MTAAVWEQVPQGWSPPDPDTVRSLAQMTLARDPDQVAQLLLEDAAQDPTPAAAAVCLWRPELSPGPADVAVCAAAGYRLPAASADRYTTAASVARAAIAVTGNEALYMASGRTLLAMEQLWLSVVEALAHGPMTALERDAAAHVLCARIRPDLFPPSCPTPADPPQWWVNLRAAGGDSRVRGWLAQCATQLTRPMLPIPEVALLTWCAARVEEEHQLQPPSSQ